jgi:transposase-like protein
VRAPIRIGLDGRMRRVDIAERRRLARDLIAKNPGASLTEIAREAGISPTMAHDVRRQLANGHDQITLGRPATELGVRPQAWATRDTDRPLRGPGRSGSQRSFCQRLRRDPRCAPASMAGHWLRWLSAQSAACGGSGRASSMACHRIAPAWCRKSRVWDRAHVDFLRQRARTPCKKEAIASGAEACRFGLGPPDSKRSLSAGSRECH